MKHCGWSLMPAFDTRVQIYFEHCGVEMSTVHTVCFLESLYGLGDEVVYSFIIRKNNPLDYISGETRI